MSLLEGTTPLGAVTTVGNGEEGLLGWVFSGRYMPEEESSLLSRQLALSTLQFTLV